VTGKGTGAVGSTASVRLLVTLIDDRQPGYRQHAESVARLTRMVGLQLGLDACALENLRMSAFLHDIGSLRLPFGHVGSRWKLAAEERRIWETHPVTGACLVRILDLPSEVECAILGHHERWDGSGYPNGLSRTQVPLPGRILGVCDAYDEALSGQLEMNAQRLSESEALDRLRSEARRRFDQNIVLALSDALDQEREISALTRVVG